METGCKVKGCITRHYAKGYCKKHYAQVLRHGHLTPESERGIVRPCKAPSCERTDTIAGYCRKHARQLRVHGRLTPELEHWTGYDSCQVAGCGQPNRAKGLCAKHYNKARWERLKAARTKQSTPRSKRKRAAAS